MENQELRQKINSEIAKTEQLIITYQEMTKPVALDDSIGRVSRMDAINNNSVTASALRQAEDKLGKLKYMLSKLGSDDFGICLKCKTPIPIGRLLIRPESLYCVKCAK
ncbi:MAG: TraR/DksA family transcriptional regulator [Bacteroidetes bacterium HGW-Bacteroidetes-12]|nr:MAG: TraR/DksA family transcriptional regulator [Bacteroidetes bacterium HGW-Bacteroidetes-12]